MAAAPKNPGIADTLGWILVQNGETERGLALLRQANLTTPSAGMRYHLAAALSKSGKREEALRVVTELLASGTPFDDLAAAQELKAKLGG